MFVLTSQTSSSRSVGLAKVTKRSWELLESPPVVKPLDSFPAFYGTRRFNTEFTTALHPFLSLARPIQSTSLHPTSPTAILILFTHLRFGLCSGLFPSDYTPFSSPPSCYMPCPSRLQLDHSNYTGLQVTQ
jgi:hypothetical protein